MVAFSINVGFNVCVICLSALMSLFLNGVAWYVVCEDWVS